MIRLINFFASANSHVSIVMLMLTKLLHFKLTGWVWAGGLGRYNAWLCALDAPWAGRAVAMAA